MFVDLMQVVSLNARGLRSTAKIDAILTKYENKDIVCLQEVNWDHKSIKYVRERWRGEVFANEGAEGSCDVAVLIKQNKTISTCIHRDAEGRCLIIDLFYEEGVLRIINVHAPNVETDRKMFFEGLIRWVNNKTIIIGDFNVNLSERDVSRNNKYKNDTSREALKGLMVGSNFLDVWRVYNPNVRGFSRRQVVLGKLKQSRIDFALVASGLFKFVHGIQYTFNTWSDHAQVDLTYGGNDDKRGKGLWCLNNSLLEDELYIEKIRELLVNVGRDIHFVEDKVGYWEDVKLKIKKLSLHFSRKKRKEENSEEDSLNRLLSLEIEQLESNNRHSSENYELYRNKLAEIERRRCRGAAVRSRAQFLLEGERSTAFFLGLERATQEKQKFRHLRNENGTLTEGKEDLLEAVHTFYTELYKCREPAREQIEKVVSYIKTTLTTDDSVYCDVDVTWREIEMAIKSMNKNKSPGTDGLTAELFQCFPELFSPILLHLYNEMEQRQVAAERLTEGVITLIYKGKGERENLGNYRPISVLNVDYKIIAKILACRLKEVIGTIVAETQTYSIPGRNINDNILTIKNAVRIMKRDGGCLLGIDLEKAFDRVEHRFLWEVLGKFGFGEKFIKWVKLLYANAKSTIKVNGFLTEPVELGRSIRQGCPLSALLYSLVAEPLGLMINTDNNIVGIETSRDRTVKIVQYADDINLCLKSSRYIGAAMSHVEEYERASGSKVNKSKSEVMVFKEGSINVNKWGFKEVKGERKVLGVFIGENQDDARDKNWHEVIKKMKNICNMWQARGLNIRGKVIVSNALFVSKIVHILGSCELPKWALNSLNAVISSFLWKGKGNMIAHGTLIARKQEGGLQLIDISAKRDSLRVKLVGRFLDSTRQHPWKDALAGLLAEYGEKGSYNLCAYSPRSVSGGQPGFYREVLEAWDKILPHLRPDCRLKVHVRRLPFLNTPFFTSAGRPMLSVALGRAGLTTVGSLCSSTEELIFDWEKTESCLKRAGVSFRPTIIKEMGERVFGLCEEWTGLVSGVDLVRGGAVGFHLCLGDKRQPVAQVKTKVLYNILVQKLVKKPASEVWWGKLFPDRQVDGIWENLDVPCLPHPIFQTDFKLRHRRLFTGIVLHQIHKNKFQRTCAVCRREDEDIEHLFLRCSELQTFQAHVRRILRSGCGMTDGELTQWEWLWLFGLPKKKSNKTVAVNTLLAFARHAVLFKRNEALFADKKVDIFSLFNNLFKAHLKILFAYKREWCVKHFVEGVLLCQVNEEEELIFSF